MFLIINFYFLKYIILLKIDNPQEIITPDPIPEKPIKRGRPQGVTNKTNTDLKDLKKKLERVKHLEVRFKELEQKYTLAKTNI